MRWSWNKIFSRQNDSEKPDEIFKDVKGEAALTTGLEPYGFFEQQKNRPTKMPNAGVQGLFSEGSSSKSYFAVKH